MDIVFKIRNGLDILQTYGEAEVACRDGKLFVRLPETAELPPNKIVSLVAMSWVAERDDWSLNIEKECGR